MVTGADPVSPLQSDLSPWSLLLAEQSTSRVPEGQAGRLPRRSRSSVEVEPQIRMSLGLQLVEACSPAQNRCRSSTVEIQTLVRGHVLSLPSPSRLPQSSGPFMSSSEHDRWKVDSPILPVAVPAEDLASSTSLVEPANPMTVTSPAGHDVVESASRVSSCPTLPCLSLDAQGSRDHPKSW